MPAWLLAALLGVDPALLLEQGRSAAQLGRWELAAKQFNRCVELDQNNAQCALELGHAYIELNQKERGRYWLRHYIDLDREPRQSRDGYRDLDCARRAADAVTGFYVVDREPRTVPAAVAAASLKRGAVRDAAEVATKCLERDELDPDCHLQLAHARLALHDGKAARAHYFRFCQLNRAKSALLNGAPQIEEW
ncbi:MAG: hypothetical protein QM723_40730 [Myxococcaceae bacterium]